LSVSLGRQYSPLCLAMITVDTLGQGYWGNTQGAGIGIYQSPNAVAGDGGFQATSRVNNSIVGAWSRPGFEIKGIVAVGDENSRGTGRLAGVSASYTVGSLMVTAAGNRFRQYAKDILPDANAAWQHDYLIGGTYDFGSWKLAMGYYQFDPAESGKAPSPTLLEKASSYWVGSRVKVGGVGALLAQVMRTRIQYTSALGAGTTTAITYEHLLSKRTTAYVSGAHVNNNAAGRALMLGGTTLISPSVPGADTSALSLGLRHLF